MEDGRETTGVEDRELGDGRETGEGKTGSWEMVERRGSGRQGVGRW